MADILDRLDEMNESGVIKYDVYSELHDLASRLEKRKVGKWKKNEHTFWTCSECGLVNKYNRVQYAYCPNCGAEMRGEDNV